MKEDYKERLQSSGYDDILGYIESIEKANLTLLEMHNQLVDELFKDMLAKVTNKENS